MFGDSARVGWGAVRLKSWLQFCRPVCRSVVMVIENQCSFLYTSLYPLASRQCWDKGMWTAPVALQWLGASTPVDLTPSTNSLSYFSPPRLGSLVPLCDPLCNVSAEHNMEHILEFVRCLGWTLCLVVDSTDVRSTPVLFLGEGFTRLDRLICRFGLSSSRSENVVGGAHGKTTTIGPLDEYM